MSTPQPEIDSAGRAKEVEAFALQHQATHQPRPVSRRSNDLLDGQ